MSGVDTREMSAEVALAARYDRPGPRYTSYPTAPHFNDPDAVDDYLSWMQQATTSAAPLSIYVHLPFCRDICYYCACNKVVTRDPHAAPAYLQRLEKEIEQQSRLIGSHRPVTQLHWGGGTPTYFDAPELTRLMHLLATHFHLLDRPDREYAIEIDPRGVKADTIALLRGLGFNRISMGIQDFDPLVQRAINRVQPPAMVEDLVGAVRRHNFNSLSFDLIYGLPHQDHHSMAETLKTVIAMAPDRIACYSYAHLPERFLSQRPIDRQSIPRAQEKLLLHELISRTLLDAGYIHIGMDHFVLPSDELAIAQREGRLQRNFQGYSLRLAEDTLGLGVSAISQIGNFYLQNVRELGAYYRRLDQQASALERGCRLSHDDQLRRFIIMRLICQLELDIPDCNRQFAIDFRQQFKAELEHLECMAEDGLLRLEESTLKVTERGRPFLRNICMVFDSYLAAANEPASPVSFSATI